MTITTSPDTADPNAALITALDDLLDARRGTRADPRLLAFGEPMHGEQTFPLLRNKLFAHLVEHWGYRSIAVESSYLRSIWVDAFVRDGKGDLDQAMAGGFSHGFGEIDANRELVRWMAETNRELPPDERLAFYGFDAPTEMAATDSPTETLGYLHSYLRKHLGPDALPYDWDTIVRLIGEQTRWVDSAAVLDPARSPGNTADARELRLITDDLLTLLAIETPRLLAASSHRELVTAELHGGNAAGLLRYHAAMAESSPNRLARGLAVRDALMAENLRTLADLESERGPMLVFAHNSHVLAAEARWLLGEQDLRWFSAGALMRARLGPKYAVLASAIGAMPGHGIGEPPPNTLEGRLAATIEDQALFPIEELDARVRLSDENLEASPLGTDGSERGRAGWADWTDSLNVRAGLMEVSYFPLEARHLQGLDAVLFVRRVAATSRPR